MKNKIRGFPNLRPSEHGQQWTTMSSDDPEVTREGGPQGLLDRAFAACADDPKFAVHRAWGITLIFVVLYFIVTFVEMINLNSYGASKALVLAATWTGLAHFVLAVLGTFVLKRFPTSFSVGFFLGVLVVVANQNLILFATFHGYDYGNTRTNSSFSNLALAISCVLAFFTVLLGHFRSEITVAPVDAKGFRRGGGDDTSSYHQYDDNQQDG